MHTARTSLIQRHWLIGRGIGLCLIMLLLLLVSSPSANAALAPEVPDRQQTEILVMSFSDPGLPDTTAMIEGAQTQILEGLNTPIHFSFEFLASSQSTDRSEQQRLGAYLREKYRGHDFKLIIALDARAMALAEESRGKLKIFPNAALVFTIVDPVDPRQHSSRRWARTGVIRNSNFLTTLRVALAQNPGTKHVIVVAGSSDSESLEMAKARGQFRSYEPNVEFRYWTDLKFVELGPRLASVEPNSVVLFLNFLTDAAGEQFEPSQILPAISKTSNRPIYGTYESFVGKGVVGGSVVNSREIGRLVGQAGARILNGEKPENIPLTTGEFQHYVFDWRQLQRWNISRDDLPAGSSVLYWESSLWNLYRWRIFAAIAIFGIETLLIILLVQSRARRRQAEQTLRQREEELSEAQRIAQLGSWQWDPASDALTYSSTLCKLTGFDASTPVLPFKAFSAFFSKDGWELWSQGAGRCLQTGEPYELEMEAHRPDGTKLWVSGRGEAVPDSSGKTRKLRGTIEDISERKEAQEIHLRHAAIVGSSEDSIISMDPDGIILSWNLGAERMFGFSSNEIIGQGFATLIPLELQAEQQAILRKIQNGEKIDRYETTRATKTGRLLTVAISVSPIRDALGRIVGSSEVTRDVTERKRVEEELKKSEEKFSKAFRQSPLAIAITNIKNDMYLDVNDTYVQLTGYRREEVIGRTPLDLNLWVNPSEREEVRRRLLQEGSIRNAQYRLRAKDGRILVGLASAEVIEISGEECMLAVVADITDRVQAEQALAESERRFRRMADFAPVLMWMSGADKSCTDFNKEWLRFTGRTMERELGMGWAENIHSEDRERCLHAYMMAFDARRQFTLEYRMRRHDGHYRWILHRGVPRFLEDGSFAGYIGCCIDITEEKHAKVIQKELSGRLLRAQEEERARIARELHDDINQRLALLANGIQELEREFANSSEHPQSSQIMGLQQLTGEIANDIQHLSHQLHPSKLRFLGLPAAVRGLCQEFSRVHKIEIECMVDDPLVELDETASLSLYRVIQEALHNVAKHSKARHVKVELKAGVNSVHLRVSDDGVGFSGDGINSGRGLGLISMRERLRLAGGEVSIWSRPSLGTQIEAVVPSMAKRARSA